MSTETRAELQALRSERDSTVERIEIAIRKARAENGSLREIAEIVGLSHTEIRRILAKNHAKDES